MLLDTPEKIRVLAQSDRLRILSLVAESAHTGAQVASLMSQSRTRIHYHLNQLQENGLLQEVGRGKKRRHEERFFRATARHYLVDPHLACSDPEACDSVLTAIKQAFDDWRRGQMLKIDLAQIAKRLVCDGLRVQKGENVLVMFASPGLELAEAIAVELHAIGARQRVRFWSRNMVFQTLDRHTPESLAALAFLNPDDDENLDAGIFLSGNMPQGGPPSPEQMEKLPILMDAVSKWQRSIHDRGIRYLEFEVPHRGEFEEVAPSPERAVDAFWRSLLTDSSVVQEDARLIVEALGGDPVIHMTDDHGTDLTVELDIGRPYINDGIISKEDVESGRTYDAFPAGSVVFLPKTGTCQGHFVADYTSSRGEWINSIHMTLKDGCITDIKTEDDDGKGASSLLNAIEQAAGDASVLAAVRFGLNPIEKVFTGKPSLDACFAGMVSLRFGNNEILGGEVTSTMDLILPNSHATVRAGGRTILSEGHLMYEASRRNVGE